ncbi:unnamed protein product [Caenorhabditis sp. 36 PRJEB53466]|nr:unnamed protein product [Caenorhabditis sp. 36 PRJEB53466]
MWGDSEKPDPLLLGTHIGDGRHHPHHHAHHAHFGLAGKPFYHMDRFAVTATSSSTTTTTTNSTSSHHHLASHHHGITAGTSSMGQINGAASGGAGSSRTRTPQPIVMWKGETSRKKRFVLSGKHSALNNQESWVD